MCLLVYRFGYFRCFSLGYLHCKLDIMYLFIFLMLFQCNSGLNKLNGWNRENDFNFFFCHFSTSLIDIESYHQSASPLYQLKIYHSQVQVNESLSQMLVKYYFTKNSFSQFVALINHVLSNQNCDV